MNKSICAVVVTYYPDRSNLDKLLGSLADAGVDCCFVDNSETFDFSGLDGDYRLISLGENKGIAAAQNIGIQNCRALGYEKIIFFDQDSMVSPGLINGLSDTFSDMSVMIAAPVFFDRDKGFGYQLVDIKPSGFRKKIKPDTLHGPIDISVVISSGSMVKTCLFDKVGLMDECLFIDYVDTEWCLRCAKAGIKIRVNPRATMQHSIGDRTIQLFGFNVPVHSPLRRYYRVRNAIYLLRLSHVPKLLAVREILFSLIHQILIMMFVKGRAAYASFYLRAIRDGICGVMGRYTSGAR